MKIAINTLSIIPNKVGGAETFLVNLLKELFKIDVGNEYLLIVSSNNKKTFNFNYQNVRFLELKLNNNSRIKRIFFEQIFLPRMIKKENVDLFIAPGNTGLLFPPCDELLIIQSLHFFTCPELFSLIKKSYLQRLVKFSCKKARKIVTVSDHTRRDIVKYTNVDINKISVIYEGVDYDFFNKKRNKISQDFISRYNIGDKYIFSPTSLYDYKNNDLLIKAFAVLKKRKKIFHKLVIAGIDPSHKINKLKKIINKFDIEKDVIYLGSIEYKSMPFLYQNSDLTVFLSSYETFGLPILEAMAAGCPVLSSDKTSLPEVVGDAGTIVNPFKTEEVANKIYKLLIDKNIRERCIGKGLVRARRFSWESVAQRLMNVYSNL